MFGSPQLVRLSKELRTEYGVLIGKVMDGLTRPYDTHMIMGNDLMIKKQACSNQSFDQDELSSATRLEGLVKMIQKCK